MENYNKKRALIYSLLKWLQTEFFGIFIFLFFIAIAKAFGHLGNFLFGLAGLLTIVCIMADFGMKEGEKARNKVQYHGDKTSQNFGFIMGLLASVPCYIFMVALMLSKEGIIFNFMPAYKLLNACFYPFVDWAAHSARASDMSPLVYLMTGLFPLLYPLSTWIGFRITYNNIDMKTKIMYENK